MTHLPYAHLRDDLPYPKLANALGLDVGRAHLTPEKCECGSWTVHPWTTEMAELMHEEWGSSLDYDRAARAYVLSLSYDPVEREDVAEREVWAS